MNRLPLSFLIIQGLCFSSIYPGLQSKSEDSNENLNFLFTTETDSDSRSGKKTKNKPKITLVKKTDGSESSSTPEYIKVSFYSDKDLVLKKDWKIKKKKTEMQWEKYKGQNVLTYVTNLQVHENNLLDFITTVSSSVSNMMFRNIRFWDRSDIVSYIIKNELYKKILLQDELGKTILHSLAFTHNSKDLEALLAEIPENLSLMTKSNSGNTPLHALFLDHDPSQEGSVKKIFLSFYKHLKDIPIINEQNHDGNTILHLVCEHAPDVIRQVKQSFKNIKYNIQNNEGKTPVYILFRRIFFDLHANNWSVKQRKKHLDKFKSLVKEFVAAGAQVIYQGSSKLLDENENSPFHRSIRAGYLKLLKMIWPYCDNPNITNKLGETPLHKAVKFKQFEIINYLFDLSKHNHVPDPNYKHNKNRSPLDLLFIKIKKAVMKSGQSNTSESKKEINDMAFYIQFLIEKGGKPDFISKNGNNALHVACFIQNSQLLNLFLEKLPNLINHQNNEGNTPLHIAIQKNNIALISTLVSHQANVMIANLNQETPFDILCMLLYQANDEKVYNLLKNNIVMSVSQGVDSNLFEHPQDKTGLLHFACQQLDSQFVTILLNNKIDVEKQDCNGNTAFHILFSYEKLLLSDERSKQYESICNLLMPYAKQNAKTISGGIAEIKNNEGYSIWDKISLNDYLMKLFMETKKT